MYTEKLHKYHNRTGSIKSGSNKKKWNNFCFSFTYPPTSFFMMNNSMTGIFYRHPIGHELLEYLQSYRVNIDSFAFVEER